MDNPLVIGLKEYIKNEVEYYVPSELGRSVPKNMLEDIANKVWEDYFENDDYWLEREVHFQIDNVLEDFDDTEYELYD